MKGLIFPAEIINRFSSLGLEYFDLYYE